MLRSLVWVAASLVTLVEASRALDLPCRSDCDADGAVTVSELITMVTIVLGTRPLADCSAADLDDNDGLAVNELVAAVNTLLGGCVSDPRSTPTATPTPTSTPVISSQLPPLDDGVLLDWLQAGTYTEWQAESAVHAGAGPHFGRVRTFVNDALFASLTDGATQHPVDAAAVKELYGGAGEAVRGWAVMRKVAPDSGGGQGWYWYEVYDGSGGGSVGNRVCTGCHSIGRDFIRIPFPLS